MGASLRRCTSRCSDERAIPGELVHIEVKKIDKLPDGGGWRAHGRSKGGLSHGIGCDYLRSLIDDHSRPGCSEILPDEKGATCAGFLTRAADYFAACGISWTQEVMIDNHLSYEISGAR